MLFADATELGDFPVSATKAFESMSLLTPQQWQSIEDIPIGSHSEHLLTLKLDLIMSGGSEMAQFAPVSPELPSELYKSSKWKERFFAVAKTLRREPEAKSLMIRYMEHASLIRKKMTGRMIRVSVMVPEPDGFEIVTAGSFAWSVLREAGVTCCSPTPSATSDWLRDRSWESFRDVDSDVLFVVPSWNDRPREGIDGDPIERLQTQALWPALKVAQRHRVYVVHDYWRNGGAVAADHILSDFERYALNE
jgi:ABC-type Fe3+-hydroxamate transport system substrate-binding protein